MSGNKRKRAPAKKAPPKRGGKKKRDEESDMESDLSMDSDLEQGNGQVGDEVLIAGHGDDFDEPSKLPEELLKSMIKPAGQLLICGQVWWDMVGKSKEPKNAPKSKPQPNLFTPHRFTNLRVRLAVSGCTSAHSVLVTEEGKCYTFGRNGSGQLGHNDTKTREEPTEVLELAEHNIIGAACGRHHTLFLTDTGTVYACGENKSGQCGIGTISPQVLKPTRLNYRGPPIIKVGAGAEFSAILDCKGGLHTFGLPEYGQLGKFVTKIYFRLW